MKGPGAVKGWDKQGLGQTGAWPVRGPGQSGARGSQGTMDWGSAIGSARGRATMRQSLDEAEP